MFYALKVFPKLAYFVGFRYLCESDKQQGQQLQIELRPEIAAGIYSNFALIAHSNTEFVLDFASMLPGLPKVQVGSRVIMAPEHAKRLLAALQENIVNYEREFGKIEIPNQQPRTIAPFGDGMGQA